MEADRWLRIEQLYHQAAALGAADRVAFLAHECAGDQGMRDQLEALLEEDASSGSFLEEPALAIAARLVASEIPVLTGRAFGPYQIDGLLGAGGMGDVYRARDTILGRDVAIKILPEAFNDDLERLARFEQEAQFLASLSHPNIAAIYGVHAVDGIRGLVLELVDGETLAERIRRGPIPLHDAARIARQIGEALDAAHQRGIVHRDLKPSNVKVAKDGTTKVLDFGLAKSDASEAPGGATSSPSVLTSSDRLILGTASYMSPEQARGDFVDKRTDIWAFGCVCFEMLTGTPAFRGKKGEAGEPNWNLMPSTIPLGVTALLKRCLDKDPKRRRRDVGDVLADLDEVLNGPSEPTRTRLNTARLTAIVAALAVSAFAVGWWINGSKAGEAGRPFPAWHKLTFEEGYVHAARFSPGGETVLYSASWNGKPIQMFSTTTVSPESRALDLPPGGLLSVSPTGQLAVALSCVYRSANGGCIGTLARAPLLGGAPKMLAEDVQSADWGPRDTLAAIVNGRLEYPLGTRLAERADLVRMSPDGQRLASVDLDADGRLAVVVRDGQERQVLSRGWTFVSGLVWAADASAVFVTGVGPENNDDQVLRIGLDGSVRPVLRASSRIRVLDAAAPDRLLVDHSTTSRRAWIRDSGAPGGRRDVTWLGSSQVEALSNDGRMMLITVRIGPTLEGGRKVESLYPIYVRPTDGGPATFLGNGYGRAFSADGRWALTASRSGRAGVESSLILYPLGAGAARTLDRGDIVLTNFAFNASFAGPSRIVFDAARPGGELGTYVQSIDGGPPVRVEHEPGRIVSPVAPDGDRFISQRNDGSLWVATLAPRPATRLNFSMQPNQTIRQWSDDGRSVFVATQNDDKWVLTTLDVASGKALPHVEVMRDRLAQLPAGTLRISSDGRTIAYSDSRTASSLFLIEGAR
jgi:serine/threonine protein kinase